MSWVATAIVGSSVVSGVLGSRSADRAASASSSASRRSIAEQRRQFDLTRADFAPYREAGSAALARLQGGLGHFEESPDYKFRVAEQDKALDRMGSARGELLSGGALKDAARYSGNLASNEYGNWWNRQAGLAGIGQSATGSTAAAGQATAGNISNSLMQAGAARGNAYLQGGQAVNNAVQGGIQNYLLHRYLNPSAPGGGPSGRY